MQNLSNQLKEERLVNKWNTFMLSTHVILNIIKAAYFHHKGQIHKIIKALSILLFQHDSIIVLEREWADVR